MSFWLTSHLIANLKFAPACFKATQNYLFKEGKEGKEGKSVTHWAKSGKSIWNGLKKDLWRAGETICLY